MCVCVHVRVRVCDVFVVCVCVCVCSCACARVNHMKCVKHFSKNNTLGYGSTNSNQVKSVNVFFY